MLPDKTAQPDDPAPPCQASPHNTRTTRPPPSLPGPQEWRHLNGMKALGIPNTKQFFEVTTIADALALWKNLQEREKGGQGRGAGCWQGDRGGDGRGAARQAAHRS